MNDDLTDQGEIIAQELFQEVKREIDEEGNGRITYRDGRLEEGQFKKGCLHGEGRKI